MLIVRGICWSYLCKILANLITAQNMANLQNTVIHCLPCLTVIIIKLTFCSSYGEIRAELDYGPKDDKFGPSLLVRIV